jgi:hypothetical protein
VSPSVTLSSAPSDVASTNVLSAEIQLVLSCGLLALDDARNFNISAQVSGGEAVRAMERLLDSWRRKGG